MKNKEQKWNLKCKSQIMNDYFCGEKKSPSNADSFKLQKVNSMISEIVQPILEFHHKNQNLRGLDLKNLISLFSCHVVGCRMIYTVN